MDKEYLIWWIVIELLGVAIFWTICLYFWGRKILKKSKDLKSQNLDRCVCPNCGQPHDPRLIKCDQPKQDNG